MTGNAVISNKTDGRGRLRTLLTTALVGLAGSLAFAAVPLALEDGIDYTDTSTDTTQVDFSYEAGQLVFHLGADAGAAFPAVIIGESPRFVTGEVPATDFLAGELEGVELDLRAGTLNAVSLEHDASLADVVDAYISNFESLGFTITEESSAGNVRVFTFANGEGSLRAVFAPQGGGARAHIATL